MRLSCGSKAAAASAGVLAAQGWPVALPAAAASAESSKTPSSSACACMSCGRAQQQVVRRTRPSGPAPRTWLLVGTTSGNAQRNPPPTHTHPHPFHTHTYTHTATTTITHPSPLDCRQKLQARMKELAKAKKAFLDGERAKRAKELLEDNKESKVGATCCAPRQAACPRAGIFDAVARRCIQAEGATTQRRRRLMCDTQRSAGGRGQAHAKCGHVRSGADAA